MIGQYLKAVLGLFCFILSVSVPQAFAEEDYQLGGGDTVNIVVYGQSDLSAVVRISQDDGTITFPLLGEVAVSGLSPEDAGRKIAKLLKEGGFLKKPQVALTVKEFESQKISVMGQVNKPGQYLLKGESRVIDLILQAGGFKDDAGDVITVVKNENGKQVKREVDRLRFYAGDIDQNIKVSRGDFILVPRMEEFYIHGEVKNSGMYRLQRGMTVMQALSVGGGISNRGSLKGIVVTRVQSDGTTKKIKVELTAKVKPKDVLYVKERLF